MKKPLLLLAACLGVSISYGQLRTDDSTSLKPSAKSFVTELNFNPFNGSLSLNNSLNQLKFRWFTRPDFAFRLGVNLSTDGSLVDNNQPYGTNTYRFKDDKSSTTVGLNLGVEKHFAGTRRLSPYLGFDLTVTNKSMKQEFIEGEVQYNVKGGWYGNPAYNNGAPYRAVTDNGFLRYGAAIVTGFDFYMAKNFFFGYELSFGFDHTNYEEVEMEVINLSGPSNPPDNRPVVDTKNTKTAFGPRLMNGIRLGYVLK